LPWDGSGEGGAMVNFFDFWLFLLKPLDKPLQSLYNKNYTKYGQPLDKQNGIWFE
jgi:hypothetical protein